MSQSVANQATSGPHDRRPVRGQLRGRGRGAGGGTAFAVSRELRSAAGASSLQLGQIVCNGLKLTCRPDCAVGLD